MTMNAWNKGVRTMKMTQRSLLSILLVMMLLPVTVQTAWGIDLMHNSTDTASTKWPGGWGIAGGKYGQFTCATCHEPYADNLKGIRRTIGTMNSDTWPNGQETVQVFFNNMTGQGRDFAGRTTSNRVCEVCHSRTRFHNFDATNNSGGNNHPTPVAVCTSCHTHNTGFKAACGGCHGNPPTTTQIGGDYGLIGTPRASNALGLTPSNPGAHQKHKDHNMVCDTCHYINNGIIKMPNLSNTIDIGFYGFGGLVTSGTFTPYSGSSPHQGYKFKSGTSNTTIATVVTNYTNANKCSNVYCHGGGSVHNAKPPLTGGTNQSPKWDDIGQAGCGSCHGATAASTGTLGSHVKHASNVSGYSQSCELCHPAIDMSHVQGSVRWLISPSLNRGGAATYKGVASGTIGYSGELAPSSVYGSCTNITCHSDGRGGAPRVDAQWGSTAFNAKCDGCHRGNAAADYPMISGMHAQHINQASVNGVLFNCAECHAKTVSADRVISNKVNHTTGLINYSGARAGRNPLTCNTAYCHTNGKGVAGMAVSWTTGPAINNCVGCHGSAATPGFTSLYGEPNYVSGSAGSALANSHRLHVADGAVSCFYCHGTTVNSTGALSGGNHLDRNILVTVGMPTTRNFVYNGSLNEKSCASVMCHGSTAPTLKWGQAQASDCTTCHGGVGLTTGYHAAHVNQVAVNGESIGCSECHAQVVNSNTSFSNRALHANLQVNYSGARAGTNKAACAAAYCHSDGKGLPGTAVNWSTPGTTISNCKGCHGVASTAGFTSIYGEPNYVSTGTGVLRANSHKQHVGTSGASTCGYCHNDTVTSTGALKAGKHMDRSIDVINNGTKAFTYLAGEKSCSAISCHGNANKYFWGAAESADCTGCHGGNSSTGASRIVTGVHDQHINNLSINGTNYGCVECHAQTVSGDRTVTSQDLHGNGFPNYSGAKAGKVRTACNAAYCHSDGKGSLGLAVNWSTGPAISCNGCHGTSTANGAPDYLSAGEAVYKSNSHDPHVNPTRGNFACYVCHNQTVNTAGNAILNTGRHLDRNFDVNIAPAFDKGGASYVARTCSNITCHGTATPKWGGAAGAGCTGCHPNLAGTHAKHVGDLFTGGYVTMYNYTTNASLQGGTINRFGCATCHPTDLAKHRNGQVDIDLRGNKLNAGLLAQLNNLNNDSNPGFNRVDANNFFCLTVYCHSNGKSQQGNLIASDYAQTPNWYNGTFSTSDRCGSCHGNPPQYASGGGFANSHYVAQSAMGANGTGTPTETGHLVGIHFSNTYVGNKQNGYLGYSSSGNKAHGNPNVADTIGCYVCHSGIVSKEQIDTYSLQGQASSGFRCANCHTAATRTKLQTGLIVGAKWHVNGQKDVIFPNITFKSKAQLANQANALGWSRPNGYKVDQNSYDTCNLGTSSWDAGTKTCLTACHVNQPGIVWGQPLHCSSCHANQ
jgi:predicted CxxxxCH...CXXCH cytochrome family protein